MTVRLNHGGAEAMSTMHTHLDTHELTRQVQALYAQVA
jgi:hypothetical protein